VLMSLAPTLLNVVCFTTTIVQGNTLDVPTAFVIVALTNACRKPFSIFVDASIAVTEARTFHTFGVKHRTSFMGIPA
jgi:hypothetical protein